MKARVEITYRDDEGNIIENPVENQLAYSPETSKMYQYKNGNWEQVQNSINLNMSIYDMNKRIISQLPNLSETELDIARSKMIEFFEETKNKYYMLLCKDINYYTIFCITNKPQDPYCINEVISCVDSIGNIKSIEAVEGGIEIWVHPCKEEQSAIVMYLFAYDGGVIECTL